MSTDDATAREEIAGVLLRYATGIDRRDWPLFRTCFTPDVHAEYEGLPAWDGVDAITGYMADVHASMGHTMHRLSNLAIDVDGASARARTYVDAVLMAADGGSGVNAVGFYDDELVHGPDGWRIATRRFTHVHFAAIGE
jgi:3-phenylpropionate/cinnamic acid dioxygenase small subunit